MTAITWAMPSELEKPQIPSLGAELFPVASRLLPVVFNETEAWGHGFEAHHSRSG